MASKRWQSVIARSKVVCRWVAALWLAFWLPWSAYAVHTGALEHARNKGAEAEACLVFALILFVAPAMIVLLDWAVRRIFMSRGSAASIEEGGRRGQEARNHGDRPEGHFSH